MLASALCMAWVKSSRAAAASPSRSRQMPRLYQASACAGNTRIAFVYSEIAFGKSFEASYAYARSK